MPWDRTRYPPEWPQLRAQVLLRAGGKCEWCGVVNGAVGYREPDDTFVELATSMESAGLEIEVAALDGYRIVQIVLTIAHLDTVLLDGTVVSKHDKSHRHLEALAALCQKCHLNYDRDDHIRHAAETRRRKRIEAGQLELAEGGA